MPTFNFSAKTVIMLVGPTGCGKTHFSVNYLAPALRGMFSKNAVQYVSSDDIRSVLLAKLDFDKYSTEAMTASDSAFKVLFSILEESTRFPINNDIVILDTTGLNSRFRKQVYDVCVRNHYNLCAIVFDYDEKSEYFKSFNGPMHVLKNHIDRIKEAYKSKDDGIEYSAVYRIRKKIFNDINFNLIKSPDDSVRDVMNYDVIGDVHGHYNEIASLLLKLGYKTSEDGIVTHPDSKRHIVFVGDVIDKGPDTEKVVDLILANQAIMTVVKGNHENFFDWYVNHGGKSNQGSVQQSVIDEYFDSVKSQDPVFIDKIQELVKVCVPFFRTPNMIVTHAPCHNKYLGKTDRVSLKMQRKMSDGEKAKFSSAEDAECQLDHIKTETVNNHPIHISGHFSFSRAVQLKNKILLDTGVDNGNKLTAVMIHEGRYPKFVSVPSSSAKKEQLFEIFNKKTDSGEEFSLDGMNSFDRSKILRMVQNKVNFISGTVCPADQHEGDLESIIWAIDYYKSKGIKGIVLEPKYMGSRCNVYLFSDPEKKCYSISRNGALIDRMIDMSSVYENLKSKMLLYLDDKELVVLDCELMPWSALGKGLIDEGYKVVQAGLNSELNFLKESGFDQEVEKFKNDPQIVEILNKIQSGVSEKQLYKEYQQHKVSAVITMMEFNHVPVDSQLEQFDIYSRQIDLFGSEGSLEVKPFAILKEVYKDGSEATIDSFNNYDMFFITSSDKNFMYLDLEDNACYDRAVKFFKHVTEALELEGIVVKPDKVHTPGVAPYLKVRGKKYLHLTYGYDFETKYDKLLKTKRIGRKLSSSLKEFEIGLEMLKIPYSELNMKNNKYLSLLAKMIDAERSGSENDPRL